MNVFPEKVIKHGSSQSRETPEGGLSKRDLFAAMAMQALLNYSEYEGVTARGIAEDAVSCADELIRALASRDETIEGEE